MLENYRTVLYSDEPLYQKLFKRFTFKDNEYDEIVHFFDRNTNEVIHIVSSKDLIMILRKLKVFRPEVFVLVYLDSSFEYFEKLCSIIAKEELATIAFDEDDIFTWYELTSNNELPIQDDYVLKKYNKRQNKFFDQY